MRVIPDYDHATIVHSQVPKAIVWEVHMEANETAVQMGWASPIDWCEKCSAYRQVVESGHNSGFAGEGVWWTNFSCGHSEMESGDYDGR